MSMSYSISIHNNAFHAIRSADNYLVVLGVGAGEWIVEKAETFPPKLIQASEFASWHVKEYETIIRKMQDERAWPKD